MNTLSKMEYFNTSGLLRNKRGLLDFVLCSFREATEKASREGISYRLSEYLPDSINEVSADFSILPDPYVYTVIRPPENNSTVIYDGSSLVAVEDITTYYKGFQKEDYVFMTDLLETIYMNPTSNDKMSYFYSSEMPDSDVGTACRELRTAFIPCEEDLISLDRWKKSSITADKIDYGPLVINWEWFEIPLTNGILCPEENKCAVGVRVNKEILNIDARLRQAIQFYSFKKYNK